MESLGNEFGVILAAVLIGFGKEILVWVKTKIKVKKDTFSEGLLVDVLVNAELDRLKYTYGFNRVSIVNYHNGIESFDGDSFIFSSMTHERTNNANSIITEYQKIPVSPMASWLQDLDKNPLNYSVTDAGDDTMGIVQVAWEAIRTYSFKLGTRTSQGTLVCSFTHDKKDLDNAAILDCKGAAYKIKINLDKKKKL